MEELPNLKELSDEAKDALIVAMWEELRKLRLALVKKPKKTAKNSSLPPAKGFKAQVKSKEKPSEGKRSGSIGREGGGRPLSENPDQIITASVKSCTGCGTEIESSLQQLMQRYDCLVQRTPRRPRRDCIRKIDLPPIQPIVTRVERYGCTCPNCGEQQIAAVPVGMEPGSPFGSRIAALVTTLRYGHGISYSRMQKLMGEVFGLEISEGAIANLLLRVKDQLQSEVSGIIQRLRSSRLVCSDETSARVNGKNQWEWVFQNDQVCFHVIRPSRGSDVIREVMEDHRPQVWVSDLFSAQKKHPADQWQVCLAHQLRDCQYGIDAGDEIFAPVIKRILLKAVVLRRRWLELAPTTQYQYRCRLKRDLVKALAKIPTHADGLRLQKRYGDLRENLFLFLEDTTIPPTNNASEQALRWSVIFRKVTNGFRSDWGRDLFAHVRSIVNTGKRQGLSAFEAILVALNPLESLFPVG